MFLPGSYTRLLVTLLLLIFFNLLLPLLLLFTVPLYLFRYLLIHLSRLFRPDHGPILPASSCIFGASDYPGMFKTRTDFSLAVTSMTDGNITLQGIRDLVQNTLVQVNKFGEKEYPYPEMVQTVTSWMGWLFWKWDKDFRVENHVRMYDGPRICRTEEDLREITQDMICRPYKEGRSPWEIWMFDDVQVKKFEGRRIQVLIFRNHHLLGDGYSILKLFIEGYAGQKMAGLIPEQRQRESKGFLQSLYTNVRLLVRGPFDTLNSTVQGYDYNEWKMPREKLSGRMVGARSQGISVDEVKKVKNMYGCSFHAVLHAAVAGGLRNFMMEQKIKIPGRFHASIAMPVPDHPGKLRNHMTVIVAPLPLHLADPVERVKFLEKSFNELRDSTAPMFTFATQPIFGALPRCLLSRIPFFSIPSAVLSNFPGPSTQIQCIDFPVLDVQFVGALFSGNIGIGVASLTYNGELVFTAGGDAAILSSRELAQDLVDKFREEINVLRDAEPV